MDFYFEDRRQVPQPFQPKRAQVMVDLPPSGAVKVLLFNEMLAHGTRPADLARLMKVRPQDVNRLKTLRHSTKIDTVAAASNSCSLECLWVAARASSGACGCHTHTESAQTPSPPRPAPAQRPDQRPTSATASISILNPKCRGAVGTTALDGRLDCTHWAYSASNSGQFAMSSM